MDNEVDILQIKIDEARNRLPKETREAIDSVPWKLAILAMRAEKGYSFSQLEALELETELLLCGLITPEEYPIELEKRMEILKSDVEALVHEMNEKVFNKIHQELVKILEREEKKAEQKNDESASSSTETKIPVFIKSDDGKIEKQTIAKTPETPPAKKEGVKDDTKQNTTPNTEKISVLNNKLSGGFKMSLVDTDHSVKVKSSEEKRGVVNRDDPYREMPD